MVVRWSALIGASGKTYIYDFPVMDYLFPLNAKKNVGLDLKDKNILESVGFTLVHLVHIVSRQTYENLNRRWTQICGIASAFNILLIVMQQTILHHSLFAFMFPHQQLYHRLHLLLAETLLYLCDLAALQISPKLCRLRSYPYLPLYTIRFWWGVVLHWQDTIW